MKLDSFKFELSQRKADIRDCHLLKFGRAPGS